MNTNLTPTVKQKPAIFAGILCLLYPFFRALCLFFYYAQGLGYAPEHAVSIVLHSMLNVSTFCLLILGILLFLKKPNWGHTVVLGIYTICGFVYTVQNLLTILNGYMAMQYLFVELLSTLATVVLLTLSVFANLSKAHRGIAKLWIVATVLQVVCALIAAFPYIRNIRALMTPAFFPRTLSILPALFFILVTALVGKWLARYAGAEATAKENTYTAPETVSAPATASAETGYIDMVLHVLLLFFIGGIWQYIWIYKITKALNCAPGFEMRNPVTKLLLCMFIPFYYLYWIYQSAKRIDALAQSKNVPSDIATLSLIFALFLGIVAPIFMQYKLNEICKMTERAPVTPAPAPAPAPTTDTAEQIKKYKDLLDCGAITEEEYNEKKKQLLGL